MKKVKTELPELRKITSELELEKAIALNKKLRILIREGNEEFRAYRKKLVKLIIKYEEEAWGNEDNVTDTQVAASDLIEQQIEKEELFYAKRMMLIKQRLKTVKLKQKDLAELLGHSETHMSLLLNGINQFTTTDIRIMMQFLKLSPSILIPPFLPKEAAHRIFEKRSKIAQRFVRKFDLDSATLQPSV